MTAADHGPHRVDATAAGAVQEGTGRLLAGQQQGWVSRLPGGHPIEWSQAPLGPDPATNGLSLDRKDRQLPMATGRAAFCTDEALRMPPRDPVAMLVQTRNEALVVGKWIVHLSIQARWPAAGSRQ